MRAAVTALAVIVAAHWTVCFANPVEDARADDATAQAPPATKPADVVLAPASAAQVLDAVRKAGAKVVLVNVWATWCTPCREEFPDLMRFYRAYRDRGISLVLVSGDFASEAGAAKEFLASQGVDFASFLKTGKDSEFIDAFDREWSGALPATFVYDGSGQRVRSFFGPVTYVQLEDEVQPLLGVHP